MTDVVSPRHEARMLLPLLRFPLETIDTVRALIRVTPKQAEEIRAAEAHAEEIIRFRARVLDYFEVLAGLKPKPELPELPRVSYYVKRPHVYQTKFDHAAILEAVRNGEKPIDIARRIGCTASLVRRLAASNGITLRKGPPKGPRVLSPEQLALALCALDAGAPCTEIARQYGVKKHTLWKYRRRAREGTVQHANTQGTQAATA